MRFFKILVLTITATFVFLSIGCTPAPLYTSMREEVPSRKAKPYKNKSVEKGFRNGQTLYGEASFYGPGFHGNLTANGEVYDQNSMTCAHKTLPFNTMLRVTFMPTKKNVLVRVNDRGPYKKGRILDLSVEAAKRLGMVKLGTGMVAAEIVKMGEERD